MFGKGLESGNGGIDQNNAGAVLLHFRNSIPTQVEDGMNIGAEGEMPLFLRQPVYRPKSKIAGVGNDAVEPSVGFHRLVDQFPVRLGLAHVAANKNNIVIVSKNMSGYPVAALFIAPIDH